MKQRSASTTTDAPASVSADRQRLVVVVVGFGAAAYGVDEGDTVTVSVELSQAPERELVVPLSAAGGGGATSADYSGVPESVTFAEDATSVSFTFTATQDSVDDDDETVTISFGTLPSGVAEGAIAETEISIVDDDANPPKPIAPGLDDGLVSHRCKADTAANVGETVTGTIQVQDESVWFGVQAGTVPVRQPVAP